MSRVIYPLFPGSLGYEERYPHQAKNLKTWDAVTLAFEAGNPKAGQAALKRTLADPRAETLAGIQMRFQLKPAIRYIVQLRDRLPNLSSAYFDGPHNYPWYQDWERDGFLKAFPGIRRVHLTNTCRTVEPMRHIGLEYLGLFPIRRAMQSLVALNQCVLPSLTHLTLDLQRVGASQAAKAIKLLEPIVTGRAFPKLSYLGLWHCPFPKKLMDWLGPITSSPLQSLDLMFCPFGNEGGKAILNGPFFEKLNLLLYPNTRMTERMEIEVRLKLANRLKYGLRRVWPTGWSDQ